MMASRWILIGAISGFLGVALGAFGAHGLADKLDARALEIYETAVRYQMYHALALLGLGIWASAMPQIDARTAVAGWAFTAGIVVFSGSLYALALSGIKILGAITPLGGLGFLVGWIAFAILAWRK